MTRKLRRCTMSTFPCTRTMRLGALVSVVPLYHIQVKWGEMLKCCGFWRISIPIPPVAGNVGKYVAVFDAGQLNIAYPSKVILKFIQRPQSVWNVKSGWWSMILHWFWRTSCLSFAKIKSLHSITDRHQSTVTMAISFESLLIFVGSQHVPSTPIYLHFGFKLLITQCLCPSKMPQEVGAQ